VRSGRALCSLLVRALMATSARAARQTRTSERGPCLHVPLRSSKSGHVQVAPSSFVDGSEAVPLVSRATDGH
jgi:hypothetical protein